MAGLSLLPYQSLSSRWLSAASARTLDAAKRLASRQAANEMARNRQGEPKSAFLLNGLRMSFYCSHIHCCCFVSGFATTIHGNTNQDTKKYGIDRQHYRGNRPVGSVN